VVGNKAQIGFNVGDNVDGSPDLKEIEIWVAGQLVTFRDNIAHISSLAQYAIADAEKSRDLKRFSHYFIGKSETEIHQFILATRLSDIEFVDSDEMFYEHQILDWGPNTDDVVCFLVECNNRLFITVELFCDAGNSQNTIYSIEINEDELITVLLHFSQVLCKS